MGYNTNKFISNVDQNLVCNICTCVMQDSVVTLCGHSFCHSCLSTWLSRPEPESCPVCRSYTSKYDIIPNLSLRSIIQGLPVWCDNKQHGCNMVVKLEKLLTHCVECDFRDAECGACRANVRHCNLSDHYVNCPAILALRQKEDAGEMSQENVSDTICSLLALEVELEKTKEELNASQQKSRELERELNEFRQQQSMTRDSNHVTIHQTTVHDFDPEYGYGYSPSSISQLSYLISKYLLSKPTYIDRNRIFMAIKRSFTYYHNYAGYSEDVHMLLATAYASNWFPDHHRWTLERWLEQITQERFPRTNQHSLSINSE